MKMEMLQALGYGLADVERLGALWGKSRQRAGGRMNLLLSHLLDTAAVAELIWDHYLAPASRRLLDDISGGHGRLFFVWLCGIHDCGKAVPAFQCLDEEGAEGVKRAGLTWSRSVSRNTRWRHDKAGGKLIHTLLRQAGWRDEQMAWVWPLVAGHHGSFPSDRILSDRKACGEPQGRGPYWVRTQRQLVEVFTRVVGYASLSQVEPVQAPTRAVQLQVSGFIVMADWIASDQRFFDGIDDLDEVSLDGARGRAAKAWQALGLRGGWGVLAVPDGDVVQRRFGQTARPSQRRVVEVARRMPTPGLMVVEAPMGEGKTKAALAAAEVLAARFGADGIFMGMPTQATSDPMFTQVRAWSQRIREDLGSQVALLHGKRMFNTEWRSLLEGVEDDPDDYFDSVEEDARYGLTGSASSCPAERKAPAEWFLGRKRGLFAPLVVGTIDQLLYAGTRTRHVMLRMAGLAGKVVILDEVHAADVYMSQFLQEGLRWLGQARVPVVLLSATLPPVQRRELVNAYLSGALTRPDYDAVDLPEPRGYPSVTAAFLREGQPDFLVKDACAWRLGQRVRVEVLPEPENSRPEDRGGDETEPQVGAEDPVIGLIVERLAHGGCALVIRNTVDRAQRTYESLRKRFGADEVRLLHGRLTAGARAERTEDVLPLLGPPGEDNKNNKDRPTRPSRLVLVATQVAEQSFDVDVDLLVTDLTTIDLLLQRIGRLHRHEGVERPEPVRCPCVVVTGFTPRGGQPPSILPASEAIYGRYLLLRTAAQVCAAEEGAGWLVPDQVPGLVARVYSEQDMVPPGWAEAEAEARTAWRHRQGERAENAKPFLLTRAGEHERPTLAGLHYGAAYGAVKEEQLNALVRDGEPSVEVILVRGDDRGYRTLAGRSIGFNGEAAVDRVDEVVAATVRLPAKLTETAGRELRPLEGWQRHPWLKHTRALVLNQESTAELGEYQVRYDEQLGLVVQGGASDPRAGRLVRSDLAGDGRLTGPTSPS